MAAGITSVIRYHQIFSFKLVTIPIHLHEKHASDPAIDLDGGDTVDEGTNEVMAATRNAVDVDVSRDTAHVGIGPDSSYVEILRSGLER